MEKILSISIAAYNVECYLEKTLKSLICSNAVMDRLEVFIIDDGSIDRTASIAQRYVENYPNTFILIRKQNGGHGSTLNCAVNKARGKYFKMLDGDDWYETNNLQKLMVELEQVDSDIILSPYKRVYESDNKVDEISRHHLIDRKSYKICELNDSLLESAHAAEMTVRTEVLKSQQFLLTEHCAYTDDEYIFSAVLHANTYMRIPIFVYCYRIGEEGQTVTDDGRKKHWRDAGRVVSAMLQKYAVCVKEDLCAFKRRYLYEIIFQTVAFQYTNYFLAENILEMEKDFKGLNDKIQKTDSEFYEWIQRNNQSYQWLNQLFRAVYEIGNRECIVFGAGAYGRAAVRIFCGKGIPVIAYTDNDSKLWGKEIDRVSVYNPNIIIQEYPHAMIFIASLKHQDVIYQQLTKAGIDAAKIINNEESHG